MYFFLMTYVSAFWGFWNNYLHLKTKKHRKRRLSGRIFQTVHGICRLQLDTKRPAFGFCPKSKSDYAVQIKNTTLVL